MVEWVKEVEWDSWASFKTRRSTARAKALLASPAACVAARAAAARRGGARRGPTRVGQAVGAGAGGHVAQRGAARGQLGLGKRPGLFQKCRDSAVKTKQLSNHSSNENVPKSKSVELRKIYNFALRFSFKKVKDLNLI
jgi:hypothetical protein